MNNKYQESLNNLSDYIDIKGDLNGEDNISHFNKQNVETLQELIEKYEKVCLELKNTHFMDNQCKLMTLDIIEGIIGGI